MKYYNWQVESKKVMAYGDVYSLGFSGEWMAALYPQKEPQELIDRKLVGL
jgi:hypothetical protein